MLAFYGCAIQFPRYNLQRGKQRRTINILKSYRPPDVATHLPQRHSPHDLMRALAHVPAKIRWPDGGMEASRFTRPPCEEETHAFEQAASRAVGTRVTIRSVYLHNDQYRCSAPEFLLTRQGADDGFWQTFLIVERTMVELDLEYIARCVVLSPPTEQERRDLETVIACLSLTRHGDPDFHVVAYEAG